MKETAGVSTGTPTGQNPGSSVWDSEKAEAKEGQEQTEVDEEGEEKST